MDSGFVQWRWVQGWGAVLVAFGWLVSAGCGDSEPPGKQVAPSTSQTEGKSAKPAKTPAVAAVSPGRELYQRHCGACHGERGDGLGIAAAQLFPKPRDFRAGRFRLLSTANRVPSRADLEAVLVRGMPGSSMPPWAHLTAEDRKLLVDEVIRLRREGAREQFVKILKEDDELTDAEIAEADTQKSIAEFVNRQTTPGEAAEVPEATPAGEAAIARGKEVYLKQGCQGCHGVTGRGDGQQKMVDDEGLPTRPRDFTRGIFKGGHDFASLYRRTAYGMPGTPMPSSALLPPAAVVDMVHFMHSMSNEELRAAAVLRRERLIAVRRNALPSSADARAWRSAKPATMRMTPLWWRDDADPGLTVQAMHDGKRLAVRLTWSDRTADRHAAQTTAFKDAVALELYRGDQEPFLGMGAPGAPVDVWFWDADHQDVPLAVEDVYPRSVVDIFPLHEKQVDTAEGTRPEAKTARQPVESLPARAAGNPIVPRPGGAGGSGLTVAGPGSVTFRPPKSQLVQARGEWSDGRWTVVMTRSLAVASAGDGVALPRGGRVSVAFAAWDGAHRDRDGQKLISVWNDLILEK